MYYILGNESWKEVKPALEELKTEGTCAECNKDIFFDENRGLMVCECCGLVHSEKHIDLGPEWRAFDADQKKKRTRTGAPMTYMIESVIA